MMTKDVEKRKFNRGPLLLPIIYSLQAISREGYISNLSAGGCRLYCFSTDPIKAGERIDIFLNLKNSPEIISLEAQIVRVNSFLYNPDFGRQEIINYELGVHFLSVNERQQEAIKRYTEMVLNRMKQG